VERTDGLPWKEIQGFGGGSDAAGAMFYCTVTRKLENGVLRGGVYRSRDRGQTWQSAMGHGINIDKTKADQWSYGPIAQYKQVLATDARPLTVYVMNTSTGFHPPHHETVYRSDDGGDTWRATFFQDPRFQEYNVAPNYVTASDGIARLLIIFELEFRAARPRGAAPVRDVVHDAAVACFRNAVVDLQLEPVVLVIRAKVACIVWPVDLVHRSSL